MIRGKHYYFFRLDQFEDDPYPVYAIAESYKDLVLRYGHKHIDSFFEVTQLNEVTIEHIRAINSFVCQQIS